MSTQKFGGFTEGIASWRRIMASTTVEKRQAVFCHAAADFAGFVARGLEKAAAVDELHELAQAFGLLAADPDKLTTIIADAFELEQVPAPAPEIKPNGKGHSHKQIEATATLYVFPAPEAIPPRQWLFAGHYVRSAVTATVAPGGYGKTTLTLYEMIQMAAQGTRTWYISGEDPKVEIDRRIAAHCQHHDADRRRIAECLYVDDRTSFALMLGRSTRAGQVTFEEQWFNRLQHEITSKRIDVVALDPFVSFHSVPENDNGSIDAIIKRMAFIAQMCGTNFEISHHVRKPVQGQGELTVDDTRGGSAIVNAVRSCRVINRMTGDEAGLAKIAAEQRPHYVRIDKGKRNMAPSENATWWHIVSVHLPNGDNVQAIEQWQFPSAFAGMSAAEVDWVQKLLRDSGPRRASSQADNWLGHDLGLRCDRDTHTKTGAIWANKIISQWLRNKVIKKIALRDPETRKPNVPHYVHQDFSADVVPFKDD
jgi:hypothetical protein